MDKGNGEIKKLRKGVKNNKRDIKLAFESIDGLAKLTDRNFEIYEELQRGYGHDLRRKKDEIEWLKKRLLKLEELQHIKNDLKHELREFKVDVRNELRKFSNRLERIERMVT